MTELKAAMFIAIVKSVTWPETTFSKPTAPFVFGVMGDEAIAGVLSKMTEGKSVFQRRLDVRSISAPAASAREVHALLFAGISGTRAKIVLTDVGNVPILTVGDGPDFLELGGMVGLVEEDRKLRFDVNRRNLERSGLKLGSEVLSLARRVVE